MSSKGNYRTFNRVIKDCDLFGHRVQLNFNKNGRSHNTMIGGCTSIIFYIVSIAILLSRIPDIQKPLSSVISFVEPVNQEIALSDEGISVNLLIEDISETSTTVSKYNDDMKKYLTIKFL